MKSCECCGIEYDINSRRGKSGKITVCEDCADEMGDTVKYTGNMVYDHKTSATIQINKNPLLTEYINNATKLKNKGSNMTNNVAQCTKYKNLNKTENACLVVADSVNYKNKNIG